MKRLFIIALLLAPAGLAAPARPAPAGELPIARPADVGMSAAKLAKVHPIVEGLIARKRLAGAVVTVARHGKVVLMRAYGKMDIEAGKPMRDDAIFRIYSMTKPITSVAALILHDQGRLDLDAPVSKYIPAMGGLEVYGPKGNSRPRREMTVRDLLRHTSGLTYGIFGKTPMDAMYRKANVLDRNSTLEEMCRRLGKIPLAYEPGTAWRYSVSVDVLGRVVEVASGKRLDAFLAERIFRPLEMKDTAFFVPDAKLERFAANYTSDGRGGLTLRDAPARSEYRTPPVRLSGGGGLVSTVRDYLRFAVMLAGGGRLGARRILKASTVREMMTNQLPAGVGWIGRSPWRVGVGFGLGLSVRVEPALTGASRVGECGWGGAASTHFWISPADGLVVVTMEQTMPYSTLLEDAIKGIIYEAIEQ